MKVPLKPSQANTARDPQIESEMSPNNIYNDRDSSSSMSAEVEIEWGWNGFQGNQMAGTQVVSPAPQMEPQYDPDQLTDVNAQNFEVKSMNKVYPLARQSYSNNLVKSVKTHSKGRRKSVNMPFM